MESFVPATDLRPESFEKMYQKLASKDIVTCYWGCKNLCWHTRSPNFQGRRVARVLKLTLFLEKKHVHGNQRALQHVLKANLHQSRHFHTIMLQGHLSRFCRNFAGQDLLTTNKQIAKICWNTKLRPSEESIVTIVMQTGTSKTYSKQTMWNMPFRTRSLVVTDFSVIIHRMLL